MSEQDPNQPLQEGTPPKATPAERLAKAREAKARKRANTVTLSQEQFQKLLGRIETLEKEVTTAKEDIEISTVLPSGQRVEPGTIVNISTDPSRPDFRKVRWSRDEIERKYEMVDFMPDTSMTVAPHGVKYDLVRRERIRVPSIVRDLHDAEVYRLEHANDRYRPITIAEHFAAAERAMLNPGTPIWSRLYIIPAVNPLDMSSPEQEPEPAKTA